MGGGIVNPDVRAANELLVMLEKSKFGSDQLFDVFPGIFVIIERDGLVLRGNRGAATLCQTNTEGLLGKSLAALFAPERWPEFERKLKEARTWPELTMEFELPILGAEGGRSIDIWWQVRLFEPTRNSPIELFYVIGKDITMIKRSQARTHEMARDLELTQAVQGLLLPKADFVSTARFRAAGYYRPAVLVGGDWWWYDLRPDGSVLFLLGDVTGHGAAPAMVTALVAGTYQASLAFSDESPTDVAIERSFRALNNNLRRINQYWMALSALEINPERGELRWWNAGGPALIVQPKDGPSRVVHEPGYLLGRGELDLGTATLPYGAGDRLLLFTDGLYEMWRESGRRCTTLHLREFFDEVRDLPLQKAREEFVKGLRRMPNVDERDDVAFILIEAL